MNMEQAGTTAQTSYFESKNLSLAKRLDSKRAVTRSPGTTRGSTYGAMPTKNIKFEKFIELMFQSGMDTNGR